MQLAPMTKLIMASAAAGSLLAVGKYIAAARTGSAAMLCEATHDVELLLFAISPY
jgi:divalent metal cation (Fe/Co/Zn/Cd) transporter